MVQQKQHYSPFKPLCSLLYLQITRCSLKFTVTRKNKRSPPGSEIDSSCDEVTESKRPKSDKESDERESSSK